MQGAPGSIPCWGSACHGVGEKLFITEYNKKSFPGSSVSKESACSAGDLGSIPGSRRSPGEGNGNPLQYSCLENPMDGGAWWAPAQGVTKSPTRLSDFTHFTYEINRNCKSDL